MSRNDEHRHPNGVEEIPILWITAGLGCDGESVALTSATQPSIEDIVMGGMPFLPGIKFINPFYSYENADDLRKSDTRFAAVHTGVAKSRAGLAAGAAIERNVVKIKGHEKSIRL